MAPSELSIAEIRLFMLNNGCKVTNHALVKYFKPFLTQPATQIETRRLFKTYVNILATIKNENNQKYLVLRKKYLNECPTEEMAKVALAEESAITCSPAGLSLNLDSPLPYRAPPPYKPPPQVTPPKFIATAAQPLATGLDVGQEHADNYSECVNEFAAAIRRIDPKRLEPASPVMEDVQQDEEQQNKENIPRFSFSSGTSTSSDSADVTLTPTDAKTSSDEHDITDNPISVKEATRKFNRLASEEEAKILSPPTKKKPEKQLIEEKEVPEVTLAHPKAKEWIVAMAKASYHELAKLANEHPELVKLQDPSLGYTALHWASKHGNEDVIKLIAGTYKADVNARTNGGYTPLHLAMQFGRVNIFELLCNVYKANRDLMDWSGNKPLDYSKQRKTVSALTYSSEYKQWFIADTNGDSDNTKNYINTYHDDQYWAYTIGRSGNNGSGSGRRGDIRSMVGKGSGGKKRTPMRYATISGGSSALSRTQSFFASTSGRGKRSSYNKAPLSVVETDLIPCEMLTSPETLNNYDIFKNSNNSVNTTPTSSSISSSDGVRKNAKAVRKESFLRKTLRAAATGQRSPLPNINGTPPPS